MCRYEICPFSSGFLRCWWNTRSPRKCFFLSVYDFESSCSTAKHEHANITCILILLPIKACLCGCSISSLHPASPHWLNTHTHSWEASSVLRTCLLCPILFRIRCAQWWFSSASQLFVLRVFLFCRVSPAVRSFQNSLLVCVHVDGGNIWASNSSVM